MQSALYPNTTCDDTRFRATVFGVPTVIALIIHVFLMITVPALNLFVFITLFKQKSLKNQELYVCVLSISNTIMVCPLMSIHIYGRLTDCPKLSWLTWDLTVFGNQ